MIHVIRTKATPQEVREMLEALQGNRSMVIADPGLRATIEAIVRERFEVG